MADRDPFLLVPKQGNMWPERTQHVGSETYIALGGEIYAPESPTSTEIQAIYSHWVSDTSTTPYDQQNGWVPQIGKECGSIILKHAIDTSHPKQILDAAMGSGLVSVGLRQVLSADTQYAGFDLTHAMLQKARLRPELSGQSIAQADVRAMPYAGQSFDAITGSLFINHLSSPKDRLNTFEELRRTLRPEGIAIIIDTPNNPSSHLIPGEMSSVFSAYSCEQRIHFSENAPTGFPLDYHIGRISL